MGEGESYQLEMMRCLREVNADNNTVGWWVGWQALGVRWVSSWQRCLSGRRQARLSALCGSICPMPVSSRELLAQHLASPVFVVGIASHMQSGALKPAWHAVSSIANMHHVLLTPAPPSPPPCRYQSTISGSFQVVEIIETFVSYMESLERCVCIVYDATAAAGGALGVKAVRLSQAFVEAYREGAR